MDWLAELQARASGLEVERLPLVARGFVQVLTAHSPASDGNEHLLIVAIGTTTLGKPLKQWADSDTHLFQYRIVDIGRAFRAAEALEFESRRTTLHQSDDLVRIALLDRKGEEQQFFTALGASDDEQRVAQEAVAAAMKKLNLDHRESALALVRSILTELDLTMSKEVANER